MEELTSRGEGRSTASCNALDDKETACNDTQNTNKKNRLTNQENDTRVLIPRRDQKQCQLIGLIKRRTWHDYQKKLSVQREIRNLRASRTEASYGYR